MKSVNALMDSVCFNEQGLVAAIAQDAATGRVLMMAWMNADSLRETLETGRACYWSRSRKRLWRKGESSGNQQLVKSVSLDCDGDTLLLMVEQKGGIACHTGRESCFYRQPGDEGWIDVEPVLKSPEQMYGKN